MLTAISSIATWESSACHLPCSVAGVCPPESRMSSDSFFPTWKTKLNMEVNAKQAKSPTKFYTFILTKSGSDTSDTQETLKSDKIIKVMEP